MTRTFCGDPAVARRTVQRATAWIFALLTLIGAGCGTGAPPHGPSTEGFEAGDALQHAPGVPAEVRAFDLALPDGTPFRFSYEVVEGLAVYQGDMVLGDADTYRAYEDAGSVELRPQGTAVQPEVCWLFPGIPVFELCERFRWPEAVVPYTFANAWDDPDTPVDENAMMRDRIRDAMDLIEAVTVVRFVPRSGHDDYVRLRTGEGCSAEVGRSGGRQHVSLSTGCGEGAVVHELLHALGLQHEHIRNDRDEHVRILWENIRDDMKEIAFAKSSLSFDIMDYDYDSIMHYGPTAACVADANDHCVGPTIETIPPGLPIGQRGTMSTGDIAALNYLYPGRPPSLVITAPQPDQPFSRGSTNVTFAAAVVDPEGMDVEVAWRSDRSGPLGEGNPLTVFTGDLAYGPHEIAARARDPQGNEATAIVGIEIVNDPPEVVVVEPRPGSYCLGEPIGFAARVRDVNEPNGALPAGAIVWRLGSGETIGTGLSFDHAFEAMGPYRATVRATDPLGVVAEAGVSFTVDPCLNAPPVVWIQEPSTDVDVGYDGFDEGLGMWYANVDVRGAARDPEDGDLGGTSLVWTTDRDDLQPERLGTGEAITARLYSDATSEAGTIHTIRLTATDSFGQARTATVRVRIWSLR